MSPFGKSENKGDPVEHLQVGITEFMMQCENKVRAKNAEIETLKAEKENAFAGYIGDRLGELIQDAVRHGMMLGRWWIVCASILGFMLGLGVEKYGKW